jgi:hypothetical protein
MSKVEDIELTLIRLSEAVRFALYPDRIRAIVHVRRAFIGNRTIELPKWLCELWLADGHWKETSARNVSAEALVKELEDIRELVKEAA